jgi:Ca-activated chloride channel homolog
MTLNQDTDLVPDASRLNPPILPPEMRCGHDIAVTVEIEAGVEVGEVRSPSHHIQIDREDAIVRVTLAGGDTIPNKDFILHYQVAGDRTQTTVLTQADSRGGHFALYLIPALNYRPNEFVPKDVVFLIDTSGSQMGDPLFKCQELMRCFIGSLNPDDTFNIVDFANTTQQLSPVPLANTAPNQQQAIAYINRLTANGGTEMLQGIRTVLNLPVVHPGRLRSIVLLTDGYIGNENQILAEVQRHLQPGNRLYSFGVGSSVNRFLLNRIAEIGRGVARIIRHDEPTQDVAQQFVGQINKPVLTNIQVSWEGTGDAPMFYPEMPPDLFAQQPLVLSGRKHDRCSGKLHVSGTVAGGDRFHQVFNLKFEDTGNPAVAQLWGRDRIKHLTNQMVGGDTKAGVEAVTDTALTYRLLSQYTAFVAIDAAVRMNPNDASISVQVPVAMPEGVSYEGIYSAPSVGMQPMAARSLSGLAESAELRGMRHYRVAEIPTTSSFSEELEFEEIEMLDLSLPEFEEAQSCDFKSAIPPASPSVSKPGMALPPQRLTIAQAAGLDGSTQDLLLQHLQAIELDDRVSGTVVFEFQVRKGRVTQIVLDDRASSIQDSAVLDELRRLLQTWTAPRSLTGSIRVEICVAESLGNRSIL